MADINDEESGVFQSSQTISDGNIVNLKIFGVVKVIDGVYTIKISIENEKFGLKILNGSRLFIDRLSGGAEPSDDVSNLQSFSVRMQPKVWVYELNKLKNASFAIWGSHENSNSFVDTNLFVSANGIFVAARRGLFLFLANIVLQSEEKKVCKNTLVLVSDENVIRSREQIESKPNERVTINLFSFERVEAKGDRFWIEISSTCDRIRVHPNSTFSGSRVPENYVPKRGVLITLPENVTHNDSVVGWNRVNLKTFKPFRSQMKDPMNTSSAVFEIDQYGITSNITGAVVYVSVRFYLAKPQGLNQKDNLVKLRMEKVVPMRKKDAPYNSVEATSLTYGSKHLEVTKIDMDTRFYVKKGDVLRFDVFLPNASSGEWILLKDSSVSLTILSEVEQYFQPWHGLYECIPIHPSSVQLFTKYSKFRIAENGVYLFRSFLNILEIQESMDIELALMYKPSQTADQQRTLLYTMESGVSSRKTLNQASSVRLRSTDNFQVFIRSVSSTNGIEKKIKADCYYDLKFLGDHNSIVGFQSSLKSNFIIQGNLGYFTINNFRDPLNRSSSVTEGNDHPKKQGPSFTEDSDYHYNTYEGFDHAKGVFTAPFQGVYQVSMNLVVKHLIMTSTENYAAAMIKVNNKDTVFFSLKQHKLRATSSSSTTTTTTTSQTRNTSTSFCMAGNYFLLVCL